jgi:hypothetical protein
MIRVFQQASKSLLTTHGTHIVKQRLHQGPQRVATLHATKTVIAFVLLIALTQANECNLDDKCRPTSTNLKPVTDRKAEYAVDAIFTNRWSPRALSGQPLKRAELMQLFEAARFAR